VRGAVGIGLLALGLLPTAAQAPDRSALSARVAGHGRFIVAFELRADRREEFVWPHPTFPAASYARVLLVADRMPQPRPGGSAGRDQRLSPSRHLRINGRLREPRTTPGHPPGPSQENAPAEFVVELDAGRLRLSLVLPPGVEIDARHDSAHITLYEVELRPPGKPPARAGARELP